MAEDRTTHDIRTTPIQIREKAGLEEALINQDFMRFLQRWSGPLLTAVMCVSLGFYGWNWYKGKQATKLDTALAEFENARTGTTINPEALLDIASAHAGVASVSERARLEAADIYLDCVRRGIKVGAKVRPDGTLELADDLLSAGDRDAYLNKASESYQWVVGKVGADSNRAMFGIAGLYGLAAVAESRGKFDEAKATYERLSSLAQSAGYAMHVTIAKKRIDSLPALATITPLPNKSDVPEPLVEAPVDPLPNVSPGNTQLVVPDPTSSTVVTPISPPITLPDGTPAPTPTPPSIPATIPVPTSPPGQAPNQVPPSQPK